MMTIDSHRVSLTKITLLLLIILLSACYIVPKREFSDYNRVFEQVRKVGEAVVMDYAVAKKEQQQLKQREQVQPARKNSFNSQQLLISTVPIDDISLRFQVWKVVGSYNKILTQLIAGEPIETESKSLLNNLLRFSVNALRSTAANISPSAAALNAILTEIEKGFERRKIIKSIEKISPIISSQLIANMKQDSELFYSVRYGINNYHYQQLRVNISRHIATFITLANSLEFSVQNRQVYPLVDSLNRRLTQIAPSSTGRGFKAIKLLKSRSAKTAGKLTVAQLKLLKTQILRLLDQAEQYNIALEAYRNMLTAYVRLLGQVDLRLRIMQQTATTGSTASIKLGEEFEIALIKMRQALLYYQKNQLLGT
jgi:hypothetical protein